MSPVVVTMYCTCWKEDVCCPVVRWDWYHQRHTVWCSYWRWLVSGKCFEQLGTFHYGEYQHLSILHIQPQTLHGKLSGGLPHREYDAHTNSVQIPHQQTCKRNTADAKMFFPPENTWNIRNPYIKAQKNLILRSVKQLFHESDARVQ